MAFLDKALDDLNRKKAGTYALLKNWSGHLESTAKINAPWTDRTGNTRQGLNSDVEDNGEELVLFLAHSQQTGEYLEEGTGLHGPKHKKYVIRPKDKKALFWDGARHPVKEIHHPGMKSKPVIEPTLNDNLESIKQTIRDLWEV